MTRPVGKTREERRHEMLSQPSKYPKTALITMLRVLSSRTGVRVVYSAHPFEKWTREEIVGAILDREFMCGECRGTWAHNHTCQHYRPCPVGHSDIEACPQCTQPNADPAATAAERAGG